MRRRRSRKTSYSFINMVARLPWHVGVLLGVALFLWVRSLETPLLSTIAFLPLVACLIGSTLSFIKKQERKRLYNQQKDLHTLTKLSWQEFEKVVGEYFRRQGYKVFETGLGGPDGGIDLIIQQDNKTYLIQCKHWKRKSVPVTTVREMWGLRDHHKAHGIKIVSLGSFTQDAFSFSKTKDIELISGHKLVGLIRGFSSPSASSSLVKICPSCQSVMRKRTNKATQDNFWGCSSFPKCRTTLPFSQ